MKNLKLANLFNLLFVVSLFSLLVISCNNEPKKEQPTPTPKPTPTPIPQEEKVSENIPVRRNEIEQTLDRNFLRCDDNEKERWFTLVNTKNGKQLYEFTHWKVILDEYSSKEIQPENSIEHKLWDVSPLGIIDSEYYEDAVKFKGELYFHNYWLNGYKR